MNCQILIRLKNKILTRIVTSILFFSFLIFCTGYGVQFDHGDWKPMLPRGHPRMSHQPKRQNLERIENQGQQRTHSASLQIKDNVVDSKPVSASKDNVKTPLSIKQNQVVKNNGVPPVTKDSVQTQRIKSVVATDRAGEFFSRPPPPVTINLRHANGRNAQRSPSVARPLVQSVRHNINHNTQPQQHNSRPPPHHSSRPLPQHNSRPLPQHNSINVRPPQHHSSNLQNVRQHNVRSGLAAVPVQLRSSHNNVRLPHNFNNNAHLRQGRVLEENNALQNQKSENKEQQVTTPPEGTTEDIVMTFDFEDIEAKAKAKTERAAFIDPAQLEVSEDKSGHGHEAEGHHEGGHKGQHEGEKNLTQASDPHGEQQFCVDISEYLDLKWVIKDSEECHVTFTK